MLLENLWTHAIALRAQSNSLSWEGDTPLILQEFHILLIAYHQLDYKIPGKFP